MRCLEVDNCIFVSMWSDSQRVRHIPCQYDMKPNGTEKVRLTARAAAKPSLPALRHRGEGALWLA